MTDALEKLHTFMDDMKTRVDTIHSSINTNGDVLKQHEEKVEKFKQEFDERFRMFQESMGQAKESTQEQILKLAEGYKNLESRLIKNDDLDVKLATNPIDEEKKKNAILLNASGFSEIERNAYFAKFSDVGTVEQLNADYDCLRSKQEIAIERVAYEVCETSPSTLSQFYNRQVVNAPVVQASLFSYDQDTVQRIMGDDICRPSCEPIEIGSALKFESREVTFIDTLLKGCTFNVNERKDNLYTNLILPHFKKLAEDYKEKMYIYSPEFGWLRKTLDRQDGFKIVRSSHKGVVRYDDVMRAFSEVKRNDPNGDYRLVMHEKVYDDLRINSAETQRLENYIAFDQLMGRVNGSSTPKTFVTPLLPNAQHVSSGQFDPKNVPTDSFLFAIIDFKKAYKIFDRPQSVKVKWQDIGGFCQAPFLLVSVAGMIECPGSGIVCVSS